MTKATPRLTAAFVNETHAPKAPLTDQLFYDDGDKHRGIPGFALRVRAGGSRNWVFTYKIGGKTKRITFGEVSAMSVPTARTQAEKFRAMVRLGQDPAGEKAERKAKAETQAANTFGALLEPYLASRRPQMRERSFEEIERHLRLHSKPLHDLPIASVDRLTIKHRLDHLTKNNGPVLSNHVRASMSKFLKWAASEGYVETNQASFTTANEQHARKRALSLAELRLVWEHLPPAGDDFGDIVRLLILTGQRREEIGALRWSELNEDHDAIELPGARTKNKAAHTVPLSAPARAIIDAREHAGRDLVFGTGKHGYSGFSHRKARLEKAITESIAARGGKMMAEWTIHDLRRSAVTGMAEIGIEPHIIEAVVNHQSGHKAGVAGTYNQARYEPQKRDALDRWAAKLMAAIEERDTKLNRAAKSQRDQRVTA